MNRGEGNEREEGGRPATVEEEEDAEECVGRSVQATTFIFAYLGLNSS